MQEMKMSMGKYLALGRDTTRGDQHALVSLAPGNGHFQIQAKDYFLKVCVSPYQNGNCIF